MYRIIVIIVRIIAAAWMKLIKSFKVLNGETGAHTLCYSCVNVHLVKGYRGRELMFCNYGGELHVVDFAVCECTGYRDNSITPAVRVAGFVHVEDINQKCFPATVIRIADKN
jgi:hypothetical protein